VGLLEGFLHLVRMVGAESEIPGGIRKIPDCREMGIDCIGIGVFSRIQIMARVPIFCGPECGTACGRNKLVWNPDQGFMACRFARINGGTPSFGFLSI